MQGLSSMLIGPRLWTAGAEWQLEELVELPDRAEAEPLVEVLRPVRGVGEQEDRIAPLGRGGVHGRQHRGARVAAAAAALERAHLVHLAEALGGIQPAGGGRGVRRRREVAGAERP